MKVFRVVLAALTLAMALVATSTTALASCAQQSFSERAANAQVIAVGVVTETRQTFVAASGVIRFAPERVLKGTLTREVQVYLGPTHGGAISSVDYSAVVRGERHTLYLRDAGDGSYETNACSGSHVGDRTDEEEKALGTGVLVAAASETTTAPVIVVLLVVLFGLMALAIVAGLRRRRAGTI